MEKTKQAVLQIDVIVYSTLVCACQHTGAEETCLAVFGVTLLPPPGIMGTNMELLPAFRMVRVPLTLPQYLVGRLENLYIDSPVLLTLVPASGKLVSLVLMREMPEYQLFLHRQHTRQVQTSPLFQSPPLLWFRTYPVLCQL